MKTLALDIETYSSADLGACGVYRYAEAPDFRVLLIAYARDGGAVCCADIERGEQLPPDVLAALTDPAVTKTAYNATFERVCLSSWLGLPAPMSARGWQCSMVEAARAGYPLGLKACGDAMGLGDDERKLAEGRRLVRKFCTPGPGGRRVLPDCRPTLDGIDDTASDWYRFKQYCIRDVEAEQAILRRLSWLRVPSWERVLYVADAEINDRGFAADLRLAANAERFDAEYKAALLAELRDITGLANPNSLPALKAWLWDRHGVRADSLSRDALGTLAARTADPGARRVLEIRAELGKTSTKKYTAIRNCACRDGRVRGLMQFYGASRTGRWAGRLVQVQNLPQNHLSDLDAARRMVLAGDFDEFALMYGRPSDTLSELIRTAFVAPAGLTLHVCDFSAIEARVVAWLAGEAWVLDVFSRGGDIYCATAAQMFGVPVEKHGANAHLRAKGKVAVLALGYGGGPAALKAMGGERMGMTEAEMRSTVNLWRRANPNIRRLWSNLDRAARASIEAPGREFTINRGIVLRTEGDTLTVALPSGRTLCYPHASCDPVEGLMYRGTDQTTHHWCTLRTYGGKLTENVVQAVARDILAWVLLRARRRGLRVVAHVHDEIIVEADPAETSLDDVARLFSEPIPWAPGLPLKGAGYSTPYYLKD